MNVKFDLPGEDSSPVRAIDAVPRRGDTVVIDGAGHRVTSVVWDMDQFEPMPTVKLEQSGTVSN